MAQPAKTALESSGSNTGQRAAGLEAQVQLALEVRSGRFGFAVLQGTSHLLDWGVREYEAGTEGAQAAISKLSALVMLYAPSVVITRRTRRVAHRSSKNAAQTLRRIEVESKRRALRLIVLDRRAVRKCFTGFGCKTKYEVACWLVEKFEELKWRLPRRRKPWDREEYVVPVFDALATVVAFSNAS